MQLTGISSLHARAAQLLPDELRKWPAIAAVLTESGKRSTGELDMDKFLWMKCKDVSLSSLNPTIESCLSITTRPNNRFSSYNTLMRTYRQRRLRRYGKRITSKEKKAAPGRSSIMASLSILIGQWGLAKLTMTTSSPLKLWQHRTQAQSPHQRRKRNQACL